MKIAISQPCFFPYEGYFNMVSEVDKVIFLDNVFFSGKDWVNKTILNINDKNYYFRIPLKKQESPVSRGMPNTYPMMIKDAEQSGQSWKKKFVKVLNFNYKFKNNYDKVMPIIKEVLEIPTVKISELSAYSVFRISNLLNINPRYGFSLSSTKYSDITSNFESKVLEICKREKATELLCLPYLKDTLDPRGFEHYGVKLSFIRANYPKYSIIDKIMEETL
jgi:hypothetical protein